MAGAGNDCIDLMTSTVTVYRSDFSACNDKGLSIGEASRAEVRDTKISNSAIGIEVKDGAETVVTSAEFADNATQINAYHKNWRYGAGGTIKVENSSFSVLGGGTNIISSDASSTISVTASSFEGELTIRGPVEVDGVREVPR